MEIGHRHWAAALLAAALIQLVLAALLQRPYSEQSSGRHAGVEIRIGSGPTGAAARESRKTDLAAADLSPSFQTQTQTSALLKPAFAATTPRPDRDEPEAVSLPIPQPEKRPTSAKTSPVNPEAKIQSAGVSETAPPEEKSVNKRVEEKTARESSGVGRSETNGGQSTLAAAHRSLRGRDGSGAAGISGAAGSGGNSDSAGIVSPDYYRSLTAWLEKHKRYPRRAMQRRQQGVVKVSFRIDREGNLLSRKIISSSGYPLLDEAADSLLQRASPMPGIPHHSTAQVLEVIVPIMYALR